MEWMLPRSIALLMVCRAYMTAAVSGTLDLLLCSVLETYVSTAEKNSRCSVNSLPKRCVKYLSIDCAVRWKVLTIQKSSASAASLGSRNAIVRGRSREDE